MGAAYNQIPPLIIGRNPISFGFNFPGRSYDTVFLTQMYLGITQSSFNQRA
jgi:hypothetical protein